MIGEVDNLFYAIEKMKEEEKNPKNIMKKSNDLK